MNIAKKTFLTLCVLMVIMTGAPLQAATPEESFRKSFPDIPLESITPTAAPGLYEIVAGGRVAYYVPGPEYLIVGEIITKERKNLTQERNGEIMALKIEGAPSRKSPEDRQRFPHGDRNHRSGLRFCRKASDYFATRNDVTRYVFLYPLSMHPNAEAKIRYIFCAKDQAKAYEEAMTGKLDDMKFKTCEDAAAANWSRPTRRSASKIGIEGLGTPIFVIDGQVVRGANMPQIEKILGAKK